jgi:phosphatidate cytidylyltransferase
MSNFWQRLITGTIFITVLIGAIVLGGWFMHLIFGLVIFFGLIEFYTLFDKTESKPQKVLGTIIGTSIYTLSILAIYFGELFGIIAIAVCLGSFVIIAISELYRNKKKPIENIAITIVGIIYLVIPFILLNQLSTRFEVNSFVHYTNPVLAIFILIWSNDTLAYCAGRLFGKHKLFERISPKKTWEGFIGGVVFSIVAGIILAYFLEDSYLKYVSYALVVSIIGTLGDLVESMLKRSVDVKDSGSIFPGHGGILDRFDAVIFVVPIIFFLEKFIFV